MNDELAERVGLVIRAAWAAGRSQEDVAKCALAALTPGDEVPAGVVLTGQHLDDYRYDGAVEMQEMACVVALGAVRPKDKSDDYCEGYFQGRKEAADEIAALPTKASSNQDASQPEPGERGRE